MMGLGTLTHNTKRETHCYAVGMSKCWGYLLRLVYDGLGNFRQKDSGALIFSNAGTLLGVESMLMAVVW